MLTRRQTLLVGFSIPFLVSGVSFAQSDELAQILDEEYPPLDISAIKPFGSYPPDAEIVRRAQQLAAGAPNGDDPLRIVRYFIAAGKENPELIAQTAKNEAWNPLILEFFRATDYKAANDMVPWCAAFVNWCLKRAEKKFSGSAASQSFLHKDFKRTNDPKIGDLAVFTCYDPGTGKSVGLGHVAFVAEKPKSDRVLVAGGNQSNAGRSMICEKYYPLGPVDSKRTINGQRRNVIFKLNTYVAI